MIKNFTCQERITPPDQQALVRYGGLTGSPNESGQKRREKGLSRSGNPRVRNGLIQFAWRFLKFQPDSELACWYRERTRDGRPGIRKKMIVALARKLLVALSHLPHFHVNLGQFCRFQIGKTLILWMWDCGFSKLCHKNTEFSL